MADFTNQFDPKKGDQDAAAERINSAARDKVDEAQEKVKATEAETPKTPEEMGKKMGSAPKSKKRLDKKLEEKKKAEKEGPKKFEVDLDKYTEFVDRVTSDPSKDFQALMERYAELKSQGCNIQRLDTAASGMSAEAGEFMEIVKKLKFQGKDFNAANKEHLTKELGDIMWYVAQACLALGVRFDEVIYINTLKLAARYPGGMFETNYSENRAPGDI
jgi:NTP pyrophosphatase (non-canonical NTP hydrolase)|tara:strand:+ start:275 stop:925 length:651 start_codon:yes stop_codon:yes gene_type:complete